MKIRFTKKYLPAATIRAPGPRMLELRANSALYLAWRFYKDHDHKWRWQQMTVDREVIVESLAGYVDYEQCLADAKDKGYVVYASHTKLASTLVRKPGK